MAAAWRLPVRASGEGSARGGPCASWASGSLQGASSDGEHSTEGRGGVPPDPGLCCCWSAVAHMTPGQCGGRGSPDDLQGNQLLTPRLPHSWLERSCLLDRASQRVAIPGQPLPCPLVPESVDGTQTRQNAYKASADRKH